jgi:hypothetical protein
MGTSTPAMRPTSPAQGPARVDDDGSGDPPPVGDHAPHPPPGDLYAGDLHVVEEAGPQPPRPGDVPLDDGVGVRQAVPLVERPRQDPLQVDERDHAGNLLRLQPAGHHPQPVLHLHVLPERGE